MPDKLFSQLSSVFQNYSDAPITEYKKNEIAFANEAYTVFVGNGKRYVVRILKTQSPENAKTEAVIQNFLQKSGIGSPSYLKLKNGDIVGLSKLGHFTISEFIEGDHPSNVSIKLIEDFGSTLAKIHIALRGISVNESSLQWLKLKQAKQELSNYSGPLKSKYMELFTESEKLFQLSLPKALIHSDFMTENVFAKDDKITVVFDFETADYNYRILDLARAYLSLRKDTLLSSNVILSKLVDGYNAYTDNNLTKQELTSLDIAIKFVAVACSAWCANNGATETAEKYISLIR